MQVSRRQTPIFYICSTFNLVLYIQTWPFFLQYGCDCLLIITIIPMMTIGHGQVAVYMYYDEVTFIGIYFNL